MRLINVFFVFEVFAIGGMVQASEQNLFYNLHQATNILEQSSKGQCKEYLNAAEKFLIEADKAFGTLSLKKQKTQLEKSLHELWRFQKSRKKSDRLLLGSFRYELHKKAQKIGLKHQDIWYKEVAHCGQKNIELNSILSQ